MNQPMAEEMVSEISTNAIDYIVYISLTEPENEAKIAAADSRPGMISSENADAGFFARFLSKLLNPN